MTEKAKVQMPSVGRIVLYVAHGSKDGTHPSGVHRAAIITEVDEPSNPYSPIGLCVLNPTGQYFNRNTPFGDKAGGWIWPPYVPPVEIPIEQTQE